MSSFIIRIGDYNVPMYSDIDNIQSQIPIIIESNKFKNYIQKINTEFIQPKFIRIDAVKWFCKLSDIAPNKLGFLFMEVTAIDKRTGLLIPGVVFLRGDSVGISIYVEVIKQEKTPLCGSLRPKKPNEKYALLTKQIRIPCGDFIYEITAGMVDGEGNIAGVAIKEIEEETGLKVPNIEELIPLGNPIIPSGGGCDETIQLYHWNVKVTEQQFIEMQTKIYGEKKENETIRLEMVPLNIYERKLLEYGDAKAISAHHHINALKII